MKLGDKVIITKGEYKNAIRYITSILGDQVVVQPNENADRRVFNKSEIRVLSAEDD